MLVDLFRSSLLIGLLVLLAACGGDSSGGDGSDNSQSGDGLARISSDNAGELGVAATEGAAQSVEYQELSNLGFRPDPAPGIESFSSSLSAQQSAVGITGPFVCIGGSFRETDNPDGSTSFRFDDCGIGFGFTVDGQVNATSSTVGDITTVNLVYLNFSIEFAGESEQFNFQVSCATNNLTSETRCAFPNAPGIDGRLYNIFDSNVSGNAVDGYSITATVVDPDHGTLTIVTTNPLIFGCDNNRPMSGALQFIDGNGVIVDIIFNDCATFAVIFNGVSQVFNW